MAPHPSHLALVGYGEVGRIFGAALAQRAQVTAFDVLVDRPAWSADAHARATSDGVRLATSLPDAVAGAGLVLCAVTAARTAAAVTDIASHLAQGAVVLDVNSAAPGTKQRGADAVARAGGRYVEAAILNAVPPQGIRVPMLLGGPHAAEALPMLEVLGFNASVHSERLGVVSALKLCRSVVMKGMEALLVESMLAARRYGVEDEVLATLQRSYPGIDWKKQATYAWGRVAEHGRRRAEEMRESAVTVRDAGIEPRMASATAEVQAFIADARESGLFEGVGFDDDWRLLADRLPKG